MALVSNDFTLVLSTTAASGGNLTAQPDPNASLGGYVSTSALSGTPTNNLYDNVTGAQNAASAVDYRCLFVRNDHSTLTALAVSVWVQTQVSGGASVQLGVDPTAASAKGSSSPQAVTIVNESSVPGGVTFSTADSSGAALSLGALAPGQVRAFWLKRSAANSGPKDTDGITLEIDFDTQE